MEMRTWPTKRYDLILVDPPWPYSGGRLGCARDEYDLMPMKELKALPVSNLAKRSCVLLLWTTGAFLEAAIPLMQSWGFRYVTMLFVWVKTDGSGKPTRFLGRYTRQSAEFLIMGRRGKAPPGSKKAISNVVISKTLKHSVKPEAVRGLVDAIFPVESKIELFARTRVANWDAWGNECPTTPK